MSSSTTKMSITQKRSLMMTWNDCLHTQRTQTSTMKKSITA